MSTSGLFDLSWSSVLISGASRRIGLAIADEQWHRLEQIFSQGVADWSKPGVAQTDTVPWLSYAAGPGGEPFRW